MAYSWVKYSLDLYTRSGHAHLITIPFYAIKMTASEYTAFQNKYRGYSNKTLIESSGNITEVMAEMVQDEITRSPSVYARLDAAANDTAKAALDTALQNARIVLHNSRDISELFFSVATENSDLSVSYSLDGGTTIFDSGAIGYIQSGNNYVIHIAGDISDWIGYASFSNITSPDIALPVPVLVDNGASGYYIVVSGGPGYNTNQMAVYRMSYSSNNYRLYQFSDYAEEVTPEEATDPYGPGGDTGDDDTDGTGGDGDFDGSTEPIDFPDLPTVSAVDTKFITIFNPSRTQLTSLAEYMWSPLFDLDTLKKLWANPMDCILGLTMVPFSVPNGGTGTVAIGNISTGISMTKAGSQYVAIDCGSINVKEFWGGYLDYDPYTKFQIYLPYVGIKPLLADEIMGKSIHVKYHCDILTGACNCFVKCGGSVLYSFNGQCSTQIPISGNDWRNTISAAVNIAGQAAGMYMTGGATAPMAITSIAQSAVNGLKPTVEKSGSLSGTGGMLAIQKPYLIATRPKQAVAKNQNKFTGYPAFITRTLSSCKGYTEVYSCHLENIPCTSDELNEIENLLKAGVIL